MTNKINKFTIKGKTKILETSDGLVVIKKKNKDLSALFDYLSKRDLNIYPEVLEETSDEIKYKYYKEFQNFETDTDTELMKVISSLHYKTAYYKNVSRKKYKDIYNTLIDNVDYLKDYYNNVIKEIDNETYMSPSSYLLARNFTIINTSLIYIEKELNSWYNLVKDKTKERVAVIHNNLKKDNFINGEENILISWDNYLVDTPILDIYKLYRNEYKSIDFINALKTYNENFTLTKEEQKLFFIMISMPKKIEEENNEYKKVKEIKELLDYMYRTNKIVSSRIFN